MTASSIFAAILGAIKAVPVIDGWFRQLIALYLSQQAATTVSKIADAAAFAARAKTDEERFQASAKWQSALSRPRILPD